MSLSITSLNSGSNGNCYYVGNENEAVLIDAGISCLQIEKRMLRLGLSMQTVKAIFISHEHADHIRGINTLAKKYGIPVYITPATLRSSRLTLNHCLVLSFVSFQEIHIGELKVTAFPKFHDAADPHSFIVKHQEVTVGIFTDIGMACKHVISYFKQCHAAFLEANYDEVLLEEGSYPYFLKNRIQSENGHLSNRQALELFRFHKPQHMSHLVLGHLSKNNNCPVLVQKLFHEYTDGVKVVVASRFEETPLYKIG